MKNEQILAALLQGDYLKEPIDSDLADMLLAVANKLGGLGTFAQPANPEHRDLTYGQWQLLEAATAIEAFLDWQQKRTPTG